MEDLSLGERGAARLGIKFGQVRCRPAALVATLVGLGAVASAVPAMYTTWTVPQVAFDERVLAAAPAIGVRVQLGLAVAAVLLLIDRLATGRRLPALFAAAAGLGAVGAIGNLGSVIVVVIVDPYHVESAAGAPGVTVLILGYLASAMLAGLTLWLGVIGDRITPAINRGTA